MKSNKKLELALEKFKRNHATAWKAARIADIPLTQFLDILVQRRINLHYGIKEQLKQLHSAEYYMEH